MNVYYLGSALNLSALYMIAGNGSLISIKSGDFNLGGEGQIYLGGFVSAVILTSLASAGQVNAGGVLETLSLPTILAVFLALSAAFASSALMAALSAVLKNLRNADFLFTSYIASAAIIPFIDGLISGPARSQSENLLATAFIPQGTRLQSLLPPSPLNASLIIALALCVACWLLLKRTAWGRKLCVLGISPEFSSFAGYENPKLSLSSALLSGGLHGLAGAAAVLGTYFTCHQGFYSGMGWNALTAALIANANPLLLIPSSLFMGFVTTYANRYALYNNFGFDISSLIQAVILFVIAFPIVTNRTPGTQRIQRNFRDFQNFRNLRNLRDSQIHNRRNRS